MEVCSELKQKYDACFNSWFSEKFLKGDTNDSMCASLLKVYKDCVAVSLKRLPSHTDQVYSYKLLICLEINVLKFYKIN